MEAYAVRKPGKAWEIRVEQEMFLRGELKGID